VNYIHTEFDYLRWKRDPDWKVAFRERVKPSLPGVDADTLFESERVKRKRNQITSDHTPKIDGPHNPNIKVDGSPVPRWWLDREAERREHLLALNAREKAKKKASKRRHELKKSKPTLMIQEGGEESAEGLALHPMDHVGIDTCSARSVSSEIADFLYLDRSDKAIISVSLNGVGNGGPQILGRGPMLVSTLDSDGVQTFMVDPAGVLIANTVGQARLRIYGQQRMNQFGYCVVQDLMEY
jgi:hypothetical protein